MTTFLICLAVLAALMLVVLAYLFATAPIGWQDADGFHLDTRSVHNGRYTK